MFRLKSILIPTMARLLSSMFIALVMIACQRNLCCQAQTVQQRRRYKLEESTQGEEREPLSSSSIFKLSNLLPSFMRGESSRLSGENKDRSKKRSLFGTSTSTLTNYAEHREPSSATSLKASSEEKFPSTSQNQESDNGGNRRITYSSSLSDTTSTKNLRQSATELHETPERPTSYSYVARTTHDSDRTPIKRRSLDRTSSRLFQRSMMKMPMRARLDVSGQSSPSNGKQPAGGNESSNVFTKIKEFAERSYSLPSKEEVVRIGDAEIPRRKVTAVGDVDGNKVTDYIVSNLAANNYSGTVRLYLMGEGDNFLYTRDLVPGKWGFEHPELSAGDRFGATVFRLPSTGSSSKCFIAIAAPGDRSTKDQNGSVYILELTEKGNVKNHKKLSAKKFLELVEEQQKEEETRGKVSNKPLQMDGRGTSGLQHLDGVSSMLFINTTGGVQAVLNVKAPKHNNLLKQIETHLADENGDRKHLDAGIDRVSSRVAQDDSCLFSETECACKVEASNDAKSECFDVFQSTEKQDKVICLKKSCPPVYICSCEGKEKCRRMEQMEDIYIPDHRGDRGELYCTSERRLVSKTVPSSQT